MATPLSTITITETALRARAAKYLAKDNVWLAKSQIGGYFWFYQVNEAKIILTAPYPDYLVAVKSNAVFIVSSRHCLIGCSANGLVLKTEQFELFCRTEGILVANEVVDWKQNKVPAAPKLNLNQARKAVDFRNQARELGRLLDCKVVDINAVPIVFKTIGHIKLSLNQGTLNLSIVDEFPSKNLDAHLKFKNTWLQKCEQACKALGIELNSGSFSTQL